MKKNYRESDASSFIIVSGGSYVFSNSVFMSILYRYRKMCFDLKHLLHIYLCVQAVCIISTGQYFEILEKYIIVTIGSSLFSACSKTVLTTGTLVKVVYEKIYIFHFKP